MRSHLVRSLAGLILLVGIVAPSAATVTQGRFPARVSLAASRAPAPRARMRALRARPAGVPAPPGCNSNGSPSFRGMPAYFDSQFPSDDYTGPYSGSVAGIGNQACDVYNIVGTGRSVTAASGGPNVIGGDGSTADSGILAGSNSTIEQAVNSAIGTNFFPSPVNALTGNESAIVAGSGNSVSGAFALIGAGAGNQITNANAFVGAGTNNTVSAAFGGVVAGISNTVSGSDAAVVSGQSNTVSALNAVVGGGLSNSDSGYESFLGSGQGNAISSNGSVGGTSGAQYSVLAGGLDNTIKSLLTSGAKYGVIGGGERNTLTAFNGVIAGGAYNNAGGDYAAIPGGYENSAQGYGSFAAGVDSQALNDGAFVWSDNASGAKVLSSTGSNQFLARASGGFYLYSSANLGSGVKLAPGSGSWSTLSDRAAKTDVASIDDGRILAKVAALPFREWSYSAQGDGVRHLGPMAQDFRAAFGLGEDDRHISTVDEEGVALAAIKALAADAAATGTAIAKLRADKDRQIADLRGAHQAEFADIARRLAVLESRSSVKQAASESNSKPKIAP